jgi:competence protein ComGF
MKLVILILSTLTVFSSCEKKSKVDKDEPSGKNEVAIYILKSSRQVPGFCKVDPSTAVLSDTPLVKNNEIIEYFKSAREFRLTTEAQRRISMLRERTNFAVTVDKKVIYYGVNMPLTMSSTCPNSITMHINIPQQDRIVLQLGYPAQAADPGIADERNNEKLLNALESQNKLR